MGYGQFCFLGIQDDYNSCWTDAEDLQTATCLLFCSTGCRARMLVDPLSLQYGFVMTIESLEVTRIFPKSCVLNRLNNHSAPIPKLEWA